MARKAKGASEPLGVGIGMTLRCGISLPGAPPTEPSVALAHLVYATK